MENRWRNIRDGFKKYQKKLVTKSGDGAKTVKAYKYAKNLSFLIPHLADRPSSGNLQAGDSDDEEEDDTQSEMNVTEDDTSQPESRGYVSQVSATPSMCSSRAVSTKKRKRTPGDDDMDATICEYFKKKIRSPTKIDEKPDDVDLFLQSIADSIRKLSAYQRSDVKYKIHGIVHEAEMKYSFPQMMAMAPLEREQLNLSDSTSKRYMTSSPTTTPPTQSGAGSSSAPLDEYVSYFQL